MNWDTLDSSSPTESPHPSVDELRRFLADDASLSMIQRQTIEAHINSCIDQCDTVLRELTKVDPRTVPATVKVHDRLPRVPGYEITNEIGAGGMGIVYRARHIGLDREVALKMLPALRRASTNDIQRFHNEARVLAQIQHPNIVQVFDFGEVAPHLDDGGGLGG